MNKILLILSLFVAFPAFAYTLEATYSPAFVLNNKANILEAWAESLKVKHVTMPEEVVKVELPHYILEGKPEPFVLHQSNTLKNFPNSNGWRDLYSEVNN